MVSDCASADFRFPAATTEAIVAVIIAGAAIIAVIEASAMFSTDFTVEPDFAGLVESSGRF